MTPSQTITDILSTRGSQEEKVVKLMELMREAVGAGWSEAISADAHLMSEDEYLKSKREFLKQYDNGQ